MMSNGQPESETLSRLSSFEQELTEYTSALGLGRITIDQATEAALNFSIDQIQGMSPVDLATYSYKLQSYSLYLQKQYNRVKNLFRWANHNISIITAKYGHEYGTNYTKYEERRALVCANNSYGIQLNKIILDAGARMEELDSISIRVGSISKALSDIQQCKRFNNG